MKRNISFVLVAVLLLLTSLPLKTSAATVRLGDVDNDSQISALDMAAVKQHLLGTKILSGNALTAADVNANGEIEALDLSEMKQYLLGKITKFSGEGQQQPTGVGITWMDGKLYTL